MNDLEAHLIEITRTVWKCTLGLDVSRRDAPAVPAAPVFRATVTLRGAWDGELSLSCPDGLARETASLFFGKPAEHVSDRETADAVGELANMTGGNLKAVLPGPCRLSTPATERREDDAAAPGALRLDFACGGRRFAVELTKEDLS